MLSSDSHFPVASVHGRFQPLHKGHLAYIQAALARCDFLYIGITQYRRRQLVQVDSASAGHRAHPINNPLTFFERVRLVDVVLTSCGVKRDRFAVLPFPIEESAELYDFLPSDVPVFTTTYDDWNRAKIDALEGLGYTVINLWTKTEKEVVGHTIREMIRDGAPGWRNLVPAAASDLLDGLDLAGRLRKLALESA